MKLVLWITGSAGAVAAALAIFLAANNAQSGDLPAYVEADPIQLTDGGDGGKAHLRTIAVALFGQVNAQKMDVFSMNAGLKPDGNGGQIRFAHFKTLEEDCGTAAERRVRLIAVGRDRFSSKGDYDAVLDRACWKIDLAVDVGDPAKLALVDAFAAQRLAHADPATLGMFECRKGVPAQGDVTCVKVALQVLNAVDEARLAPKIRKELDRLP